MNKSEILLILSCIQVKDETKISYLRRELGPQVDRWLSDLPLPAAQQQPGTEAATTGNM